MAFLLKRLDMEVMVVYRTLSEYSICHLAAGIVFLESKNNLQISKIQKYKKSKNQQIKKSKN